MKKARDESSRATSTSNLEDSNSGFLNVAENAGYLGIKTSTVYSLVEAKQIPHYRIGRQIRFKKSDIDEWMEKRKEEVVDIRAEAKKIFTPIKKKADLDINTIIKKTVEEAKGKRYTSPQEKPGRIKGLGKEVEDGII